MVEFILTGAADPSARIAKKYLYNLVESDFFFVKIKDETKLILDPKDYENDISLKGEFIRLVMASDAGEADKIKIIRTGLEALAGEEITVWSFWNVMLTILAGYQTLITNFGWTNGNSGAERFRQKYIGSIYQGNAVWFSENSRSKHRKQWAKKYLPWQGGTYGGSLDFEFEGISYRVWRTFGKTAAKDRFSLRDLTNRSVSTRFTEKLGEELFQLDAESFMRSVYMPQMQNQETAATTSIQTKLSNLVDNTDDLNNYDSAMDHLRTARSEYRKFRGSGGHIDDIQTQIERLEQKLTDAETKKYPLAEATGKVEALNAEKSQKEEVLSALREK